jgi:hypothetical protein
MNAPERSTRYRPEYGKLADDSCLPGASSLELAGFLGIGATRRRQFDRDPSGAHCAGNTTPGVLLFSRPFIPVRKNYLTRRAGAWGLTSQRGRSLLVVQGIPGQRAGSSRRLRDRRTARHLLTDHRPARRAERPFFLASFQGARFSGGRGGVAPQAVVGHDALPPPPVLGYSNTLFLAPAVPLLEKLSAISPSHPRVHYIVPAVVRCDGQC